MTDREREAGDALGKIWREGKYAGDFSAASFWFICGWQACDARYAPTLTQAEAVEKAAKAIYAVNPDCYRGQSEDHQQLFAVPLELARDDIRDEINKMACAALKAAGVRFKESGGVGT